jgi:glycosyltransferase involved in cell wall biosynthesis
MVGTEPGLPDLTVDIIIPVYNEEEAIHAFHEQLRRSIDALPYKISVMYVDDGSIDHTLERLQEIARDDYRVLILELSRNYGHQAALTAGLDQTQADYVITMDGDGQHPPSEIPEMIRLALSGYDIVIGQRIERQGSFLKNVSSRLFYRLINFIGETKLVPGSADFRLLSGSVVQSLRGMQEYHRLLRGMISWMGYRTIILPYHQPQRLAGKSKYSLRKMLRLASHAIFSFSLVPLYLGITVGAVFLLLALIEMIYVLSFWLTGRADQLVRGWSSTMFILLVVGGSLMITLGFIGIYVGLIFQEVKRRPIYLIRRILKSSELDADPTDIEKISNIHE